MSTSKTLFLEQQKKAFYEHQFHLLPLEELEQIVAPYKPIKSAEFPPPSTIYTKKFTFLSAPLKVIQQRKARPYKITSSPKPIEQKLLVAIPRSNTSKCLFESPLQNPIPRRPNSVLLWKTNLSMKTPTDPSWSPNKSKRSSLNSVQSEPRTRANVTMNCSNRSKTYHSAEKITAHFTHDIPG